MSWYLEAGISSWSIFDKMLLFGFSVMEDFKAELLSNLKFYPVVCSCTSRTLQGNYLCSTCFSMVIILPYPRQMYVSMYNNLSIELNWNYLPCLYSLRLFLYILKYKMIYERLFCLIIQFKSTIN